METVAENKLDLYEQHQVAFHKLMLIGSLLGFAWIIFSVFGPGHLKYLFPLSAIIFALPNMLVPIRFSEQHKAARNKVTLLIFGTMILAIGIMLGLKTLFPNFPGYGYVLVNLSAYAILLYLSVRARKGITEKIFEERISMILQKSQQTAYFAFMISITAAFMLLSMFNLRLERMDYIWVLFLIVSVFQVSQALAFLVLRHKY
jgi:hypothetical protein